MIKNEIIDIDSGTIEDIIEEAKVKNFYLVNLDGRTIQTKQEYMKVMYKEFFFPHRDEPDYTPNYDACFDWITDLGWLINEGYKGFVLIIDYYKSFLEQEGPIYNYCLDDGREVHTFKEYLEIEGFKDITTHWEYEVIKIRVGGEPMPFNIYLSISTYQYLPSG